MPCLAICIYIFYNHVQNTERILSYLLYANSKNVIRAYLCRATIVFFSGNYGIKTFSFSTAREICFDSITDLSFLFI
jgi:hypothetical protein